MNEFEKIRNDKLGPKVVDALKKRFFDAYYVSSAKDVSAKVLELIPKNHVVSWGGTATVDELGIKQDLAKNGYSVIDRDTAKSPEERVALMKKALTCNTFLMSANAITEQGELFNIDGAGNRLAALCYGPDSVIVVAGLNKVVADMDAAVSRVRHFAAPVNAQRFNLDTPCCKTGECANCVGTSSICCQFVETRLCKPAGRIKVILVGENLGM